MTISFPRERADVTTGALYKRYSGKDALFCAVVEYTVADLKAILAEKSAVLPADLSDEALIRAWDMDEAYMLWWFQYLVESMTEATYGYYEEARRRGLTHKDISKEEMHVPLSAF